MISIVDKTSPYASLLEVPIDICNLILKYIIRFMGPYIVWYYINEDLEYLEDKG